MEEVCPEQLRVRVRFRQQILLMSGTDIGMRALSRGWAICIGCGAAVSEVLDFPGLPNLQPGIVRMVAQRGRKDGRTEGS